MFPAPSDVNRGGGVIKAAMEKVCYLGQPNCFRLTNERVEVIVTTDTGPRVIRYGFIGEDNVLGEVPDISISTELGEWKPWGGHRLWVAPENMPLSYAPDNGPVEYEVNGENSIRLTPPVETQTGLQKEITLAVDREGTGARLNHKVTNRNTRSVDAAPWGLTIMNGGGVAILPQEPYRPHSECLLPARPMVLWHYTDLSDPRWNIGRKYIRLKTDARMKEPQKIGVANKRGWAAYHRGRTLFVKRFAYEEGVTYPDYGCNNEVYTAGSFVEVESLAPLRRLAPGEATEHVERWYLFGGVDDAWGEGEERLDAAITPLVARTENQ